MCRIKLNWLKNPNNIEDHSKVNLELLAELDKLQENVTSLRSIDFFLHLIEELCYLKMRGLTSMVENVRGGAAFESFMNIFVPEDSLESLEKKRTSLLVATMNNPQILSRLINDDKYESLLFLLGHMMEFPVFSYSTFSTLHIWEKCEQIGTRLAVNDPISLEVVVDVLVPRGIRFRNLHPDFVSVKKKAFIENAESYKEIWNRLIQSIPQDSSEETKTLMMMAFDRLRDTNPVNQALPIESDKEWDEIVDDITKVSHA